MLIFLAEFQLERTLPIFLSPYGNKNARPHIDEQAFGIFKTKVFNCCLPSLLASGVV